MWLFMSLLSAFFTATTAAVSKMALKDSDEYFVGWMRCIISAPIFLLLFLFIKIPRLDATFYYAILMLLPLEAAAYLLFLKALRYSPLSLTVPFLSLTPVFMIISTRFILGQSLDILGIAGIILVFTGAYMLNITSFKRGFFAPIRSISKEKGCAYMIIVAFIYSITAVLGKIAIKHSSHMFMSAVYFPVITILFSFFMAVRYRKSRLDIAPVKKRKWLFLSLGVVFFMTVVAHFSALGMTTAAYMIAIKRLSTVFGIIYGWLIFKERHIKERLLGSAVMISGVVLISLAQRL